MNKLVSLPYLRGLKMVKLEDVQEAFEENDIQGPPSVAQAAGLVNDEIFLDRFIFNAMILAKIPHLDAQALLAQQKQRFQIYTYDTCGEFHAVLVEYLERLHASLKDLQEAPDAQEFYRHILAVILSSCALQRMANGSALQRHLKAIAPLINIGSYSHPEAAAENPEGNADGRQDDVGQHAELDEVQPFVIKDGTQIPLFRAYEEWLRLMLVHFEAVDILVNYVTTSLLPGTKMSTQTLVSPIVDTRLLSLADLMELPSLRPDVNCSTSNKDISTFFEQATSPSTDEFYTTMKGARTIWHKDELPRRVDQVLANLGDLKGIKAFPQAWQSSLTLLVIKLQILKANASLEAAVVPKDPRASTFAMSRLKKMKGANAPPPKTTESLIPSEVVDCKATRRDVEELLGSLYQTSCLFRSAGIFQKRMAVFSGSLHCEANLASLLGGVSKDSASTNYDEVKAALKVSSTPPLPSRDECSSLWL